MVLLAEVFFLVLAVEIALRRRPFERVLEDAQRGDHGQSTEIPALLVERAIRIAYRLVPFERTCLKHSLIFCRVRRRRGLPAEIRIGVQKKDGAFSAHAWVEDGRGNVLTDPLDGFSAVPLPRRQARPDERASR